jgi:ATP synthase protein I
MKDKEISKKISESYKAAGPYIGLGTQLAATMVLMFFVGRWLDNKLNTFPILIIVCTFIGGAAGIYNFIITVLKLNEKKKIDKTS